MHANKMHTQTHTVSRKCKSCERSGLSLTFDPKRSDPVVYVCVCLCKRGFPLHSLQSGSAITLDSAGFIISVCGVCVWGSSMKGYCQHRHLPVSYCPPNNPQHPSGYVLLTLANLSSSFMLLPRSETDAERRGPLQRPLNTLTQWPDTCGLPTHTLYTHTHTVCISLLL